MTFALPELNLYLWQSPLPKSRTPRVVAVKGLTLSIETPQGETTKAEPAKQPKLHGANSWLLACPFPAPTNSYFDPMMGLLPLSHPSTDTCRRQPEPPELKMIGLKPSRPRHTYLSPLVSSPDLQSKKAYFLVLPVAPADLILA